MPAFVFLWTDVFLYVMLAAVLLYARHARRLPALRMAWASVARTPSAMCAAVVLAFFALVGLLDSVHYRPLLPAMEGSLARVHSPVTRSVLDDVLSGLSIGQRETTYSAPLAVRQFTKETRLIDGEPVRDFQRLVHAGAHLAQESDYGADLRQRALMAVVYALLASLLMAVLLSLCRAGGREAARLDWLRGRTDTPWRAIWITFSLLGLCIALVLCLGTQYHVMGTDRTGNDVLWMALKSVRTALVIGSLTTIAMLPPAIFFGIAAGYFRGWIDDLIQFLYTTLTSVPGVLLIAACVLMMQVYIDTHPDLFDSMAARADLRLFLLCLILGLTGWAGLCRMLRAETLKLRELDYVQAARAFGVGHWTIMRRHILPNLMHIVLITMTLEFSGLVLYEAVLSYLGIGVDPSTPSFGTMIDAARLEMSRDPMIWWNLGAAFAFLLALVLSANLFADAVQTAFDPRRRRLAGSFRIRRFRPGNKEAGA